MPRKNNAKPSTKRQASANTLVALQKTENDFYNVPAKLAEQLNKEISKLKKKENKLKNAVNKAQAQIKTNENKTNSGKLKTPAGKKQLKAIKKILSEATKNKNVLNKELQETVKSLDSALSKHAKLNALQKHLAQFDKEWKKNSKKLKAKVKVKAKTKVKAKSKMPSYEQPIISTESFETLADTVKHDEVTEVTQ